MTYNLIAVSRKAVEVPELKEEIKKGKITLTNARKIAPIINQANKSDWLQKASELSQRQLEKEVVKVRPQEATPEKTTYVSETRVKLELGLSEKDMLQLRRAQDLMSQSRKRPVSLEEVLVTLTQDFLRREDPLEIAKRHCVKKGFAQNQSETGDAQKQTDSVEMPVALQAAPPAEKLPPKREPIPAALRHQVNLRDQRRCTHTNSQQKRCNQTRWIEIHHKIPVHQGGKNTLENLATLFSSHHDWVHAQSNKK